MMVARLAALCAAVCLTAAEAGAAQRQAGDGGYLPDSGSPFGAAPAVADPATIPMPDLAFKGDGTEASDFDKYYAFRRADTDFATAYADIAECDGYARGLQSGVGYMQPAYPYAGTLAGAAGGVIGNLMVAAIFGSAEKRRMRRVNMRTCMAYKGYDRHGLPKAVWEKFNFEEGLSGVDDAKRQTYLRQQARVASAGTLQGKALGL